MPIKSEVHEFLKANAKKGGDANFKKYGRKHMADIARLRWANQKKAGQVDTQNVN